MYMYMSCHVNMSWTIKKAESQRIDTFELWCWRRLFFFPFFFFFDENARVFYFIYLFFYCSGFCHTLK